MTTPLDGEPEAPPRRDGRPVGTVLSPDTESGSGKIRSSADLAPRGTPRAVTQLKSHAPPFMRPTPLSDAEDIHIDNIFYRIPQNKHSIKN